MNRDQVDIPINEQIRYLCDLLHRELPLFDNCCAFLTEFAKYASCAIANWYWYNEQSKSFILFASSSPALSNYGENQVRLNDFFTGRIARNNFEPYQVFIQKTGTYKLFLLQPLIIRGKLSGCILVQSFTKTSDYDYEFYVLQQLTKTVNIELPGLLQTDHTPENLGYSILDELTYIFDQITNIRHLAKIVVRNAALIFEANTSILSLYNPTMDCFEILDSFTSLDSASHSGILLFDNSIAMKAARASTLFRQENLLIEQFNQNQSPGTVISFCLRNKSMLLGALSLYGKKHDTVYEKGDFSLADQELFLHFSDLVTSQLSRFLLS